MSQVSESSMDNKAKEYYRIWLDLKTNSDKANACQNIMDY